MVLRGEKMSQIREDTLQGYRETIECLKRVSAERDRLRAALELLANEPDDDGYYLVNGERMHCAHIAKRALEKFAKR